jgi:hypothetical protein
MTDEFADAVEQGYLQVVVGEPGSGPRVCRWRARCRKLGRASITAAIRGSSFDLEVRAPINLAARLDFEQISCHPALRHCGGGWNGQSGVHLDGLPLSSLEAAIAAIKMVVATCGSQEMREALRREQSPLGPVEENPNVIIGTVYSHSIEGPGGALIRMHLEQREYDCWSAGLAHLYDCLPKPIPVVSLANYRGTSSWQQPHRLEERFVGLCPTVEAGRPNWTGFYHLQPRFSPGLVSLAEGSEDEGEVVLGRPAFSESGRDAVFRLSGPGLTETLDGLVRLEQNGSGWRFVEFSFDQDWLPVSFDRPVDFDSAGLERFPKDFKLTAPLYGQENSNGYFDPSVRQANDALYAQLARGEGPAELLDQPVIPMLNGPNLSARQLLADIRERGEVLFDRSGAYKVPVIRFDGANWLGKLLAHLADHWPCHRASQHYINPRPRIAAQREQSVLDLLERILKRAGFPNTRCQLADLGYHAFAFQPSDSELAATSQPMLFRQPGTLWFRELNAMRFDDSPYRVLASLCQWAECEGPWLDRVWHSAAIECAWSENRREI